MALRARLALGFCTFYSACSVYDQSALTETSDGRDASTSADAGSGASAGATSGEGGTSGAGSAGTAGFSGAGGAHGGGVGSDASGGSGHSSGSGGGGSDAGPGAGGRGGTSAMGGAGGTGSAGTTGGSGGTMAGASGSGGAGTNDAGGAGPNDGASGTGGSAGASGGAAGTDGGDGGGITTCARYALPAKATWVATASHSSLGNSQESDPLYNPPSHATDGNVSERWSTGKPQAGNEWLQVDFTRRVAISDITLDVGISSTDHPRGYAARVSDAPLDFSAPVLASGAGQQGVVTTIVLTPVAVGRYLLISQTGSGTNWWTVAETTVACSD